MPELVGYLLLFLVVGVGFIFVHLLAGKLIRPDKPDDDKLTIYECGEPTIGSAWVQFDVRFYVIALLFVIFDVEVAFFFPWAVVFGKTTELGKSNLPEERRLVLNQDLASPEYTAKNAELVKRKQEAEKSAEPGKDAEIAKITEEIDFQNKALVPDSAKNATAARRLSWIAFVDILVFFGVLLVGFAYLWRRGDLTWVRSVAAEQEPAAIETSSPQTEKQTPLAV